MRKKSTRLLSAALAVCMMLSALPVGAFAAEPGAEEQENGASAQADPVGSEFVEINSTNFPDQVFLQYVKDNIDTADTTGQKDGKLSQAERDAVTEISITNTNCTDLTGIAYFANLKILYCSDNKLTGLDMSGNPALEQLLCYENNLESLNVTKNKKLSKLKCQHNGLKELNLKDNENLTELNCSYNQLTTLDVSKNAKLSILECYNNGMEELNLGDITNLSWLLCAENNLTELDVSKNPYLERLHCRHNKLRRLVIGKNYSLTMLYLMDNQLTSLDLNGKWEIWNFDYAVQSYAIDVKEDGTFDLTSLPEGFDASKTTDWEGGTRVGNTLNVNSHEVRYEYNTGSNYYRQKWMSVILKVNGHKYQWQHDDTKHWRTCALEGCSGLTDAQEAKAPHVYDNAKDKDCNTCGYVRPLYTVTTDNATAKLESEAEELKAPVAAGTEVILTAGGAPEGKTFAGWKLYKVVNDTESEITDEIELAKLLKNGIATTATLTLTMPAYNVKAEPYYSDIPYNITAVDCTVDKPEAPMGDTVTATRRALKANERFTGWTVKVNGVEQDTDTFLKPDADDPAKVSFVMPAENVEIKANFEGNPTLNIGDHMTANIDDNDASVPSGSAVPVGETVHLTAIAPEGQHFTGWTVKVGDEEQKADTFLTTPDENDLTKVTFTMPNADVEVTATFAGDSIPDEPDPVGPSDTGNIQGAISAVVIGAAAGAIIYEAGTGIYRVINMPGIPMPSNRIELAELLWEHAGKPEPVSTALYSDIDEGDTDAQKAARWAVEQDLMKDDADNNKFHPAFPVSKLRTCLTWNAAKEKGLFDKTEE
ncbi:internalin-J [Faecalibacterium cf. prausnitzii KLE1255]|uniref:Internalin-J n=1 Tax=Faecalibacterium cf. prausnitzii KLE1255 TaxID=748224 RepID=E2ZFA5_9FIRM|nr:leucine-rich repeat domain-containing protein [Faecalibacterium prausnitzii]EFQ08062.1 internalin-J [Faecalibacterium cf. prausnitzii KLE1255]